MEVLIVGAGPVGLMMGCELTRRGIAFRIIDKSLAPSNLSKALAIHARTLEVLDLMGAVEPFLQRGKRVEGLHVWMEEEEPSIKITFNHLDSPYPFLIDLPQSETERILIENLRSYGYEVERGAELLDFSQDGEKVNVLIRHQDGREERVDTLYLIGCDGSHSTVRHHLGVSFEGSEYPESFVLADVKVTWDKTEDIAHVFLTKDGILAAFPYGNSRYRVMVDIENHLQDRKVPEPTLEQIQQIVNKRGPAGTKLSDPIWIGGFRTHLRHVSKTHYERVFLVGDAAHIHSPAGGQGLNTGVQDAFNLAWKLALVLKEKAPDSLLDTFSEERLPVAESVMKMSDMMLKTMTNSRPLIQKLRKHMAPFLLNSEFIQKRMRNQVSEIAINYRKSSIVEESIMFTHQLHFRNIHTGDRVPDVKFVTEEGNSFRLYDYLRTTKHTLLLFSDESMDLDISTKLTNQFELELLQIVKGQKNDHSIKTILDDQQLMLQRFGIREGSYVLIRPDGYFSFISDTMDFQKLFEYMSRVFSINDQPVKK